jgi:hypothetical protein
VGIFNRTQLATTWSFRSCYSDLGYHFDLAPPVKVGICPGKVKISSVSKSCDMSDSPVTRVGKREESLSPYQDLGGGNAWA